MSFLSKKHNLASLSQRLAHVLVSCMMQICERSCSVKYLELVNAKCYHLVPSTDALMVAQLLCLRSGFLGCVPVLTRVAALVHQQYVDADAGQATDVTVELA